MFGQLRARSASKKSAEGLLSGLHARITEIAERESVTRDLIVRFESESAVARDAVKAAGRAREQRDEYRRVLAAAIANDRRSEARIESLDAERRAANEDAREEARRAGASAAERDELRRRVDELEAKLSSQLRAHEASLRDLTDRAWTEREAARADFVKALMRTKDQRASEAQALEGILQRRISSAVTEGIESAIGREPKGSVERIRDARRRLLVGLGAGAAVLGVALTPAAILSAIDAERAYFVHMVTGTTPWQLIAGATLAFGLSVLFFTLALRDSRSRESGSRAADQDEKRRHDPGLSVGVGRSAVADRIPAGADGIPAGADDIPAGADRASVAPDRGDWIPFQGPSAADSVSKRSAPDSTPLTSG